MTRKASSVIVGIAVLAVMQVPHALASQSRTDRWIDHVPSAGRTGHSGGESPPIARNLRAATMAGIDVSHWQGTIAWSKVADSYAFAYAKVTEGQSFNDPNYSINRSGAEGAGMLFGAYHFASPDSTANDAVLEADHFASVAAPRSGELKPVLDVERSGGLSTTALINWVQAWLDEASAKLGTRPLIYSGPYFWRTYMGDTTRFAAEGYKNLWVANWDVPEPDVPAQNWGGNSWTVWQYSDCGSVPGISGCVDLDWLKTKRLDRVVIR